MTTTIAPSLNRANGRDRTTGRFARGNAGGPGNPHGRRVNELRTLLLDTVSDDDLCEIITVMVKAAKSGDLMAGREVLDRCLGKPRQSVEITTDAQPDPALVLTQDLIDRYESRYIDVDGGERCPPPRHPQRNGTHTPAARERIDQPAPTPQKRGVP